MSVPARKRPKSSPDIPVVTVREFRATFSRLDQPVAVFKARGDVDGPARILGIYYPERTPVRYPHGQSDSDGAERSAVEE
jgi:hypothetical protein